MLTADNAYIKCFTVVIEYVNHRITDEECLWGTVNQPNKDILVV